MNLYSKHLVIISLNRREKDVSSESDSELEEFKDGYDENLLGGEEDQKQ